MREKEFIEIAKKYFGDILEEFGFSCEQSEGCTFYKTIENVCLVIKPVLNRDGTFFRIYIYATSPLIDPRFEENFPDFLGIPMDVCSYLHPRRGVSFREHRYRCRTEEGFVKNFNKDAKLALIEKAIPYLRQINAIQDMIPLIKNMFYLSVAMYISGNTDEATPLINKEIERLSSVVPRTEQVDLSIGFLEKVLSSSTV